jgi:hypothetical protein
LYQPAPGQAAGAGDHDAVGDSVGVRVRLEVGDAVRDAESDAVGDAVTDDVGTSGTPAAASVTYGCPAGSTSRDTLYLPAR